MGKPHGGRVNNRRRIQAKQKQKAKKVSSLWTNFFTRIVRKRVKKKQANTKMKITSLFFLLSLSHTRLTVTCVSHIRVLQTFSALTSALVFPRATRFSQLCGVKAFVWHLSVTSGHWGVPHYSLLTMQHAHTHVFPFTALSKRTHHPPDHYPAPSTTMSPFSVIYPLPVEDEWAFERDCDEMRSDLIYCWESDSQRQPCAPTQAFAILGATN